MGRDRGTKMGDQVMSRPTAKTQGAVIYTRVSTGEQADHGTSLDTQRAACLVKAGQLGLPVVAHHEDAGVSGGFLTSRAGMMAAVALLQAGRADTLIAANMSRFSRDSEHQAALLKSVRAAGGRIVFCDMAFEDTPTGDLQYTMVGAFAAWEKAEIRRRTYSGHVARAEAGVMTCRATAPFGYIIPKKSDVLRGDHPAELLGRYLVHEGRAAVVRELFARYVAGASLNDVSRWLNESGLPTPGGGRMWRASNVRFIIKNPVYKGVGAFGRFDHSTDESRLSRVHERTGLPLTSPKVQRPADPATWITFPVPALVPEGVWEAANGRLSVNRSLKGGRRDAVRMLSGRVFCPRCGAGMVCLSPTRSRSKKPGSAEVHTYPHRYTCGHYRRTLMDGGAAGCRATSFYVHQVEASVVRALAAALEHPEWVREALAAYAGPPPSQGDGPDAGQALAQVEKALGVLERRQRATVEAQVAGIMAGADADAYSAAFAAIAGERAALEARREALGRAAGGRAAGPPEGGPVDIGRVLADTRRVLESALLSAQEKRDALGLIIERVYPLKNDDKSAGAEVVFLPGLFNTDTLQTSSEQPEIRRLRAGKRQGSGRVPSGNSETTAPQPAAILLNSKRLSDG